MSTEQEVTEDNSGPLPDSESDMERDPELPIDPEMTVALGGDDLASLRDESTRDLDPDRDLNLAQDILDGRRVVDEEVSVVSNMLDETVILSDSSVLDESALVGAVSREHLKGLLEALIFAAEKPMTPASLARAASSVIKEVKPLLQELKEEYEHRGIQLDEVAGGWLFRTKAVFAPFVRDMSAEKPVRLSRAQLETLAILAYRQPVTRPEIDEIRGVDSGPVLKLLLERDLVRMMGKKEEPGRPILYGTTTQFLEFFGLKSLKDLPTLKEFTELSEDSRRVAEAELGEVLDEKQVLANMQAGAEKEPAAMSAVEALEAKEKAEDEASAAREAEIAAGGEVAEVESEDDAEADDEEGDDGYKAPAVNADDEAEFPDDPDDEFDDDDDDDDDDDEDEDDEEADGAEAE